VSVRYVISGHALERFEERYPGLVGRDDDETARLIQAEVEEALRAGRVSHVCPREMWPRTLSRAVNRVRGGEFVWTPARDRGYAICDRGDEVVVTTVLRSTAAVAA